MLALEVLPQGYSPGVLFGANLTNVFLTRVKVHRGDVIFERGTGQQVSNDVLDEERTYLAWHGIRSRFEGSADTCGAPCPYDHWPYCAPGCAHRE